MAVRKRQSTFIRPATTHVSPGRFRRSPACSNLAASARTFPVQALDESQVRIGDVFGLGSARIQVCQPRNPCWKIDVRFGEAGVAAFIAEHRLTGWYFRVIEPGNVSPDAALELVAPATGAPSLAEAMDLWHSHRPSPQSLRALAALPGIASNWQRKIVERAAWLENNPDKPAPHPIAFHVKPEGH